MRGKIPSRWWIAVALLSSIALLLGFGVMANYMVHRRGLAL